MSSQFNIRDMPERSLEQISQLCEWTGYTKTQMVLIAIERLWLEAKKERENKMSSGERRACVISISLPSNSDIRTAYKDLREIFRYVHGESQKCEMSVICAGPKDLTYDEAFIICQKKYFEVGWVYADAVGKREWDAQPRFVHQENSAS